MRRSWHSPIVRRFLQIWRESWIGSTSRQISDRTHMQCYYFSEYLAYKLSIYRVQRRIGLFAVTFGAAFVGYIMAGWGANWFTGGYAQGNFQPDDFSRGVMSFFGGDEKKRYLIQHSLQMREALLTREGDLDTLEWLVLAKHYSKNGEEETAF